MIAVTLFMGYVGIRATAWVVSRFDTTLTAWWWFLLALPVGVVVSGGIGLVASLWVVQRMDDLRVDEPNGPSVVGVAERRPASGLPTGSSGEEAFADATGWVGFLSLPPGATSQWHHHGEWTSYAVVQRGVLRWEFGDDGAEAIEVGPGDTGRMPAWRIHRDVSAGEEPLEMVLFRAGRGPLTTNVDGPAGA